MAADIVVKNAVQFKPVVADAPGVISRHRDLGQERCKELLEFVAIYPAIERGVLCPDYSGLRDWRLMLRRR